MEIIPTGTVTFVFTDIEGSTVLWERAGNAMRGALDSHNALLSDAISAHGGFTFKTVGDAFCAAFTTASDALSAALGAQRALRHARTDDVGVLHVRMALHTGTATVQGSDYFGPPLNRCSRLLGTAHGGQILLSATTRDLVRDDLPSGVTLLDLGRHRLRDLTRPEHVFQVVAPDLPRDFPSLRSLDALPNNLPVQLTSLVGRERELAQVEALLAARRLVTITGTGGCGKTRLALQAAANVLDDYPDGVWLVELAALADPALVLQTAAAAVGVHEGQAGPLLDQICHYLGTRRLLLVLDNCEHVIEACAELAETLLHACPDLRILATSREALGCEGESTWPAPSLALPGPGDGLAAEQLSQYEAVRLFIDRAQAVAPEFQVTNANAPALAELCARLDGIPLAIELAAARIKVLTVDQILARLDDRFWLLTGGRRTALPRQQTLRAAVDWSYDLLSPNERKLFTRLAVFRGGCVLDAAEAVCTCADIPPSQILDLLSQLVEKSLVNVEREDPEARYQMLETIRHYAREKLMDSGEGPTIRMRHYERYASLAEQAAVGLDSQDRLVWLARVEPEYDNLRGALEWATRDLEQGAGEAEPAAWLARVDRLLELQSVLWDHLKPADELERVHRLCRLPSMTKLPLARARLTAQAASLAFRMRDYETAVTLRTEAMAVYHGLGDNAGEANQDGALGWLAMLAGDFASAFDHFNSAIDLHRESGRARDVTRWQHRMGIAYRRSGDLDQATVWLSKALETHRAGGKVLWAGYALHHLGDIACDRRDYAAARRQLTESLDICSEYKSMYAVCENLEGLAWVATAAEDDPDKAARLLGAAANLRDRIGVPLPADQAAEESIHVAELRERLGGDAYTAAFEAGRRMRWEDAVALALADEPEGDRSIRPA